jgi:hypothetical protein
MKPVLAFIADDDPMEKAMSEYSNDPNYGKDDHGTTCENCGEWFPEECLDYCSEECKAEADPTCKLCDEPIGKENFFTNEDGERVHDTCAREAAEDAEDRALLRHEKH